MSAMSRILCVGEALIDVVTRPGGEPSEHVGGSLLNVANGIAQLGHRSSICSWWGRDVHGELIAAKVVDLMARLRATATISYDPNVRPAIMGTPADVLERVEALVALSDVVKASDEDLDWLYPGVPVETALRRWADLGPALAVCTRGPLGAYAVLRTSRDHLVVPQNTVTLADTVGAGDSFMAGLVSGLTDAGLLGGPMQRQRLAAATWAELATALHRAVATSSITVSHAGAYAPSLAEVRAVVAADPYLA